MAKSRMIAIFMASAAMAGAQSAWAQEQAPPAPPAADDAASTDDIVVTAQRRAQNLQDVPMAISAYSGDQIQKLGASQLSQVFASAPSVRYATPAGNSGFPVFNIRGVTLLDFSYTNEASVAVYADEVYLGNPFFATQQLFDVERVEILRGPQGTLYGRNATGGLVNFISRRPTATFQARGLLQYSSYDDIVAEGAVSGPLAEGLRLRVAARYNSNDGWQRNLATGTRLASVDHAIALRATVEADLAPAVLLTASGHFSDTAGNEDGRAIYGARRPGNLAQVCPIPDRLASLCVNGAGFGDPNPDPRHVYSSFATLPYDMQSAGGFLRVDADLGGAKLTSISSYDWGRKYDVVDSNGAAIYLASQRVQYFIRHRQMSQELRLGGETGGLTWLVGGYYYHDKRFFTSELTFNSLGNIAKQTISSVSAFAQATYAVTDVFNVTAGLRYTSDRKTLNSLRFVSGPKPATEQGTTIFDINGKLTPKKATWQIGADYKVAPDVMLFAKVSTGFKTGGWGTSIVTSIAAAGPVGSETLTAYEAGIKSRFLDRLLTVNLTGYFYDYKGIQATASVPCIGCPNPSTQVYINLGDSYVKGLEAEFGLNPSPDLSATVSVALNDNKLRAPLTTLIAGTPVNGKRLANSPKFAMAGNFSWEPSLGDGNGNFLLGGDFTYQSDVYFRPDNIGTSIQKAYAVVGARIGWLTPGQLRIEAYARNLFDKHYFTARTDLADYSAGTWAMPRQIGIRFSRNF